MNKLAPEFLDIETWIFDLDNTLYHSSINLFDQIDKRMCDYVSKFLEIPASDAYKIQKSFFREHGTTLRGMMECHNMDPKPYLDYVHDIDFSNIKIDGVMANALDRLPGRKIIFTNATKNYAERVLKCLKIEMHIENIFDIIDAGYIPKPAPKIYSDFINKYNINPRKAIMVEDMARNLIPAANLGMKTVWVKTGQAWAHNGVDLINPDYTTDNLSQWLDIITGN
jgi:putative hydrolase of the HAD superfamily